MNNKKHLPNLDDPEISGKIVEEIIHKMKTEGGTLQEHLGISDEVLEGVYTLAYGYYNQGKYKESVSLFELLVGTSPKTYKYMLGLASSYHQLEYYTEASLAFFIALPLSLGDPLPAYYIADCFMKQNLRKEASEYLDLTIDLCDNQASYREVKERCILIKKSINKDNNAV